MTQSLLTYTQAETVAKAILDLSRIGGRPSRFVLPARHGLHIRIRFSSCAKITVLLIDEEGRVMATRRYASFEQFVAEHAECAEAA